MKQVAAVLDSPETRDEAGRLVLGDPSKGCRHCGAVAVKEAANGKAIIWHPAVECCADAVNDQIRFREGDLETLQKAITAKEQQLELLRQETGMYDRDSKATEATKAFARLRMAEEQHPASLAVIRARISGDREAGEIGVTGELRELKTRRAGLLRAES